MKKFQFTSEKVSVGNPNKLCDYISDCIVDACQECDNEARVSVQTLIKGSYISSIGKAIYNGEVCYEQVIRKAQKELGYTGFNKGLDYKSCYVVTLIDHKKRSLNMNNISKEQKEDIGQVDVANNENITRITTNGILNKLVKSI